MILITLKGADRRPSICYSSEQSGYNCPFAGRFLPGDVYGFARSFFRPLPPPAAASHAGGHRRRDRAWPAREKTLGSQVRLIYYHGAWVWTGKVAYALAALTGLAGLLLPAARPRLTAWSLALGRTGLVFWLTYLPLSLLVQQLNWGGIYWDEPRWRIPAAFWVATVLLQAALLLFRIYRSSPCRPILFLAWPCGLHWPTPRTSFTPIRPSFHRLYSHRVLLQRPAAVVPVLHAADCFLVL